MAALTATDASTALVCRAGRLLCALPLGHLVEIMRPLPLERLPGAPAAVMGTAIVRGDPLPVVDIGLLLGEPLDRPGRFVIARTGARRVALAVTETIGFRSLAETRLGDLPPLLSTAGKAAISAIGALDGELLVLLEATRLVPEDVFGRLAPGIAAIVSLNVQASEEAFRGLVADRLGLRFDDGKLGALGNLLRRRAEQRGNAVEHYLARIDDAELAVLAEELTVGETYFFRNNDQFRAFREVVLPDRMERRAAEGELRFLSAGCSSGEEPYSIAMIVHDAAPNPPWRVSIRAADVNPAALRKARAGRFGTWALRETPGSMLSRWFIPDGRDMRLTTALMAAVQFDRRNLADPHADIWQPAAYDAVFCRNVIMYFSPAVQHAVIGRIAQSLAPGGYLFLGHAETLRGLSQDFHLVHTHDTFYYQRKEAGEAASPRHHMDMASFPLRPLPTAAAAALPDASWYEAIGRASRRIEALADASDRSAPGPIVAPSPNLELVLDLLQRERFAEALALIADLPPEVAADPDVLLVEALLLVQDGKLAAAADVCRILLAADEMSAGANFVLGLCLEGTGASAAAMQHYAAAGHLDPRFAMPRLRLGLLARRAGRLDDARRDLLDALELLRGEDTSRLLLFGGGFTRAALSRLCETELTACGEAA